MNLLSLLALLLSLLYTISACAPNAGVAPTPAPSGGDTPPPEEGGGEEPAAEEKRRRRSNVMTSSDEKVIHRLPEMDNLHTFHVRNDSVRVVVHEGRERE